MLDIDCVFLASLFVLLGVKPLYITKGKQIQVMSAIPALLALFSKVPFGKPLHFSYLPKN